MNKYEMLYIVRNDIEDDAKQVVVESISALVESLGGVIENVDKWGTKRYAYPINFKNEGYYVLMNFTVEPTAPLEIERRMTINDNIVRKMIVRK